MRILFFIPLLISMFYLASCQTTGAVIRDTPMSLAEIRRVTITVIGDPRKTNENGHELESTYFDKKKKPIERPNEVKERYYTRVTILGDRRPYDIQVQCLAEIRTPDGYEDAGEDDGLATEWASEIKKALHESREKRNFIDDFKAF